MLRCTCIDAPLHTCRMHIHMYRCVCADVPLHARIYTCTRRPARVCPHAPVARMYAYTCAHTLICSYTHGARMHTFIVLYALMCPTRTPHACTHPEMGTHNCAPRMCAALITNTVCTDERLHTRHTYNYYAYTGAHAQNDMTQHALRTHIQMRTYIHALTYLYTHVARMYTCTGLHTRICQYTHAACIYTCT